MARKAMETKRILVVEDDSAIRQGLVDALQFAGYEVLQAANGNDGLAQALRATFDLLLLDLILPGHSGFEILEAVHAARPTLPVIILTARGEEADRVQGPAAGRGRLRGQAVQRARTAGARGSGAAPFARAAEPASASCRCPTAWPTWRAARCASTTASAASCRSARSNCSATWPRNAGRAISRDEILQRVWRLDPEAARDPHHRHAHRPPAREAAGRSGRARRCC